jgi:phospholipase/carboxylesterase
MRKIFILGLVLSGFAAAEVRVKTESYPTGLAYTVELPSNYDTSRAYPLIVALHGWGDKMSTYVGTAASLCPQGAIGLYPESPYPVVAADYNLGWSWWVHGDSASWLNYDMSLATSVDWILHSIEEVKKQYHVDSSKVFLFGFSQGGMLTFHIGLRHPRLFCGLLPAGGWIEGVADSLHPLDSAGVRNLPIRAFNGAYDDAVNPDTTWSQVNRLRAMGVPAEALHYPVPHELTAEMYDDARDFVWARLNSDQVRPLDVILNSSTQLTDSERVERLQAVLIAREPVEQIGSALVSFYHEDTNLVVRGKVLYLLGARRCTGAETLLTRVVADRSGPQELRQSAYTALIKLATESSWRTAKNAVREATIEEVIAGSNGDKAGLRAGDVILSYAGRKISLSDSLRAAIGEVKPGAKEVTMVIRREGKIENVELPAGRIGIRLSDRIK